MAERFIIQTKDVGNSKMSEVIDTRYEEKYKHRKYHLEILHSIFWKRKAQYERLEAIVHNMNVTERLQRLPSSTSKTKLLEIVRTLKPIPLLPDK